MNIRHFLPNLSCRQTVEGARAFLLQGKEGWLSLWSNRETRYEGWFVHREGTKGYLKLIERITYRGNEPLGLTRTESDVLWDYADGERLAFQITKNGQGVTMSALHQIPITLTFDVRGMYDSPSVGRSYTLTEDGAHLLLTYLDGQINDPIYLHIRSHGLHEKAEEWYHVDYPRDAARNSGPTSLYVYELLTIHTDHLSIGYGTSATAARKESADAYDLAHPTIGVGITSITSPLKLQSEVARIQVEHALAGLQTPKGIYAGLPWFHQVWSRDELIAALGLSREEQKAIIERYVLQPLQDGELFTFIDSGTTCSDGLGWLALLVKEYGITNLTRTTRARYREFLKTAYKQLNEHRRSHHGLVYSGHNATWMDTIGRQGHPLEIQVFFGLVLQQLAVLTEDAAFERERIKFLGTVRQYYVRDGFLTDALDDPTVRPNAFIAYLAQPDLLSQQAWESCFAVVLEHCWCEWGALSSISKRDSRYYGTSTGQDNHSYHNGDVWFFVNALAAIAMHRCSVSAYRTQIMALLQSATNEILWEHMIGEPGEIASAENATSWGCGCQAFAGGPYLALLRELKDYWSPQVRETIS